MVKKHFLLFIILFAVPVSAAQTLPINVSTTLTVQQLDAIRSYVANSGVPVNYLVDEINKAAEEVNLYLIDGTPMNTFNKFDFQQQNSIIRALQTIVFPPPEPVDPYLSGPAFTELDQMFAQDKQEQLIALDKYSTNDVVKNSLYNEWLAYTCSVNT